MGGWSPSGPRRYANGGLITKHQMAEIGEGNKPEMVVPLTRRTRAIQLIEQAMRYVGMDAKSTNVTVNNDNSVIEKLLKQMVAMNDHNNRLTATIVDLLKSSPKGQTLEKQNNYYHSYKVIDTQEQHIIREVKMIDDRWLKLKLIMKLSILMMYFPILCF